MAVTSVVAQGIGCSGSAKQAIGSTGQAAVPSRRYRSHWRATCDDLTDTSPVVYDYLEANANTLPWFGNTLELGTGSDDTVVCTGIDVDPIKDSGGLFDIVAHYEPVNAEQDNETQPGTGGNQTADPLDWLDDIEVSFTSTLVTAEFGIFRGFFNAQDEAQPNGRMIVGQKTALVNSAKVPFDPPPEKEKHIKVIRISRNVPAYDDEFFDFYQGTTNSDEVTIDKPIYRFTAKIKAFTGLLRIGAQFNQQNGIKYYRQTTEVWVDKETWRRDFLDKGMQREKFAEGPNGAGGTYSEGDLPLEANSYLSQLVDSENYPYTAPVPMNGNGQPNNRGDQPAIYGRWTIEREVAWQPIIQQAFGG